MADISKITLPSGSQYNLKDEWARTEISNIKTDISKSTHWIGVTTTQLADGASTNPITIGGESVTAKNGDIAGYQPTGKPIAEFIFYSPANTSVGTWQLFGDSSASSLGSLAYKNQATGTITPAGSVSVPTFNGTPATITSGYTPSGSVSVNPITPSGSFSADVNVTFNPVTINSITAVGTASTLSGDVGKLDTSVSGEILTLSWTPATFTQGTPPTKGADQSVLASLKSASLSNKSLTMDETTISASFTGTAGSATGSYTPAGTVTQPTFTGSEVTVTVT